MPEPHDSPGSDPIREALRRAVSSGLDDGHRDGDWPDIVRRIRHRRVERLAVRIALPALCILLVAAGALALSLRTGDNSSTTSLGSGQDSSPVESTQLPPSASATSSAAPVAVATSQSSAVGAVSTSTTEPTTTTSVPSTTTSSIPITLDTGRTVPLDLPVAGSALIASSDGSQAFVWSLVDGHGFAIDPSSLATRPIAAIPGEVVTSLCYSDEMSWTGTHVFVASTTNFALYDPSTDSWALGTLPSPRYCARERLTVWTGSRVALLGASTAPFGDPGYAPILEAWLFDPATLQWSTSSPAPSIRDGELSAAYVGGVIVFAGDGAQLDQTPQFLVYHPGTDTWSELDPPGPLTYTPYVAAYGDQLLAIGLDNRASALTNPLNPNWQSFTPSSPPDAGRHPSAFVTNGHRLVYLYGSSSSQVSVFDGPGWFESQMLTLPTSWGSASVTKAGHFLVVAGASTASAASQSAEAFVIGFDALVDSLIVGD